ncbi:hypothetical protein [Apibacter sp. HY039]|uniref:hypothetical protein n=1 Tax=Apibacter sp. HY039 TaxID=2501476 RepID=UPI000FEB8158|nr:hypothetical protein [Apibacter sp. HY039]
MKKNKINVVYIFVFTIITMFFFNCKNKSIQVKIENQEPWYDPINNKETLFSIKLFTTLSFKNDKETAFTLERKDYNNFFIIFRKDTFALVPEINYAKKVVEKGDSISIVYFTDLYHKEKDFDNPAFLKEIENCPIKQYNNQEKIENSSEYEIQSSISLWNAPPTPNTID